MRPVLPVHIRYIDQFKVGFVHQRGRLHRVACALVLELVPRNPTQRTVHTRCQPLQRSLIPIGPGAQKLRGFRSVTLAGMR